MKRTMKQLISGVAIACVFPLLLSGCLIDGGGKGKVSCNDSSDCRGHEICGADGFCQTASVQPRTCESDADCGSNQICNEQKLCQDFELCYNDSECGANQVCNLEDYCFAPPGEPHLTVCLGLCEDKGPGVDCWHDSDCGANEFCEFNDVFENPEDASQMPQVMPRGECRPKPLVECYGHGECAQGQYCAPAWALDQAASDESAGEPMMIPPGICTDLAFDGCVTDDDCNADATCVIDNPWGPAHQGTCVTKTIDCWTHEECGEGAYCEPHFVSHGAEDVPAGEPAMEAPMGVCKQLLTGECMSDGDCGVDGVCEHPNPDMGPGTCAVVIAQCWSDNECDWNQECEFSNANDPSNDQALVGVCVEKEPTFCSSDWDCNDGEYCEFDSIGWSQFGCGEHGESDMPMVNEGICTPKDLGLE